MANIARAARFSLSTSFPLLFSLATAEIKRDQLVAELEKLKDAPTPNDIVIHTATVRELISNITTALSGDAAVVEPKNAGFGFAEPRVISSSGGVLLDYSETEWMPMDFTTFGATSRLKDSF